MNQKHTFSIYENGKKKKNIISAFLHSIILHQDDINDGVLWNRNYPYQIVFENPEEGCFIIDNLPHRVIVSYQLHEGGETFAVIRKEIK